MPAPQGKFTDVPEIAAYVIAHAIGIAWAFAVNPLIFRSLIAQGYRNLTAPALALSIAVGVVVLLIFLALRRAMAGLGGPPPRAG